MLKVKQNIKQTQNKGATVVNFKDRKIQLIRKMKTKFNFLVTSLVRFSDNRKYCCVAGM